MRKPQEDPNARIAAELTVAEVIEHATDAHQIVGQFEVAEFERTVARASGGLKIPMRRVVLTSAWEIDPAPPADR